jgi:hypothetical protein
VLLLVAGAICCLSRLTSLSDAPVKPMQTLKQAEAWVRDQCVLLKQRPCARGRQVIALGPLQRLIRRRVPSPLLETGNMCSSETRHSKAPPHRVRSKKPSPQLPQNTGAPTRWYQHGLACLLTGLARSHRWWLRACATCCQPPDAPVRDVYT